MNDILFTSVDRGGEGFLIERTHFAHTFFVLNQEWNVFRFANIRNSSTWGRNYKASSSFFRLGTPPPSVYLGRLNVIHMIKWTRPFPCFCLLQAVKTEQWEGLGMRLAYPLFMVVFNLQRAPMLCNVYIAANSLTSEPSPGDIRFYL